MSSKLKNLGLIGLGIVAGVIGSIQFDAIAQKNAGATLPVDEMRKMAEAFDVIKTNYVEPVEDKKLLTEALSGMVASLDPHSAYLDKKAYRELREQTQGKFVGLGIEVGMEDGYVKVISPIEDSPAYKAGLRAGDLITRLDATPVKGMTLDEAVKRMRGEENTKITLSVFRKDENKQFLATIVRKEIKTVSVKSKMIEPGYAWLRVTQFQVPTVKDFVKQIKQLYAANPNLKGIVLDLRNDPGGVLPGAIGVSSVFLDKNAIVTSTNGQMANSNEIFRWERKWYGESHSNPLDELPDAIKTVPMVVLVNGGSASASEIVAGALQDYKRAIIMGTQTFGKGSVQSILPFADDTALKLTTARYYTPKNRSIQAKGIVPDMLVDEFADGDGMNGLRLHEADLQKHLTNDKDKDAGTNKAVIDELEEEQRLAAMEKKRKPLDPGSKDDFQLAQALNQLKGLPVQLSKAKVDLKIEGKGEVKEEKK
jgi:carboxyl-terminal processing protease